MRGTTDEISPGTRLYFGFFQGKKKAKISKNKTRRKKRAIFRGGPLTTGSEVGVISRGVPIDPGTQVRSLFKGKAKGGIKKRE